VRRIAGSHERANEIDCSAVVHPSGEEPGGQHRDAVVQVSTPPDGAQALAPVPAAADRRIDTILLRRDATSNLVAVLAC
jgi:hypothetical protein